ncbi:MAG TPA: hypothetical protein PK306_27655, partial [Aquabacterium sp.]|nr:hypothetical protein [Aquabacterium sp.]
MARIRTIKPEFFRHEALFEAERETGLPLRLAFAGLWTVADREGRFKWRPRAMKLDVLPYDDVDFAAVLDRLADRGFVVRYEVGGDVFGAIPSWSSHQVINNRESASLLPSPPVDACPTRDPRVDDVTTTPGASRCDASTTPLVRAQVEGKGKEGNGKGMDEGASPRAPMTIAALVKDGLTEESAFELLDMRGVKGLRVLMQ